MLQMLCGGSRRPPGRIRTRQDLERARAGQELHSYLLLAAKARGRPPASIDLPQVTLLLRPRVCWSCRQALRGLQVWQILVVVVRVELVAAHAALIEHVAEIHVAHAIGVELPLLLLIVLVGARILPPRPVHLYPGRLLVS